MNAGAGIVVVSLVTFCVSTIPFSNPFAICFFPSLCSVRFTAAAAVDNRVVRRGVFSRPMRFAQYYTRDINAHPRSRKGSSVKEP